jgi:hypothetical protein
MYTLTKLLHPVADFVPELVKVMSKIWITSVPNAVMCVTGKTLPGLLGDTLEMMG